MDNEPKSGYGLAGIVRDIFRKALMISTLVLPLSFYCCKKIGEPDPVVNPSAKIEYLSPTSGNAPLSVHLKLSGTAGSNPIGRYELHVDDKVASSSRPIDTSIVFSAGNYSLFGEVFDVKNLSSKTLTTPVNVTDPVVYPPSANMSVSPTSGDAPLPVHMTLSGVQKTNPIDSLYLFVDDVRVSAKKSTIDTTITFPAGNHSVYGKVVDIKDLSYKTPVTNIIANQSTASANLSVSNTSGVSPLPVHFKLSGVPGINPFNEYKLIISGNDIGGYPLDDKIIVRSYPIDTLMNIYSGDYNVHGEIIDSKGNIIKTASTYVGVNAVYGLWFPTPRPSGPINLFETAKSTPEEIAYDALMTKAARDALMPGKVLNTITGKISPAMYCNATTRLFILNSRNFGKDIYLWDKLIYDGYDGEDPDEIRVHNGTSKYFGTLGIPADGVAIYKGTNHAMNYVLTGDDVRDPKSYNFIEAATPWLMTNVQPGQVYIPMNVDTFMVFHTFMYKDKAGLHDKNYSEVPVAWFRIVNGQWQFVATNPNVEIIMRREDIPKYTR